MIPTDHKKINIFGVCVCVCDGEGKHNNFWWCLSFYDYENLMDNATLIKDTKLWSFFRDVNFLVVVVVILRENMA